MSFYEIYGKRLSVADLQSKARQEGAKLQKKGQQLSPVEIAGRAIATTFWGKSWCQNIEAYRDFDYRLERGRSYARNGSIIDLRISGGVVTSMVSGTSLYKISIQIQPVAPKQWESLVRECAGKIGSVVELLQGKLSKEMMQVLCRRPDGLFPAPAEISFRCSCPDMASMCKHVAATMYGVGHRLDQEPTLLFTLRQAKQEELITKASAKALLKQETPDKEQFEASALSSLFGIELDDNIAPTPPAQPKKSTENTPTQTKPPATQERTKQSEPSKVKEKPRDKPNAEKNPVKPGEAAQKIAEEALRVVKRSALLEKGAYSSLIDRWLREEVLLPTKERGVYGWTDDAQEKIIDYFVAQKQKKRKK